MEIKTTRSFWNDFEIGETLQDENEQWVRVEDVREIFIEHIEEWLKDYEHYNLSECAIEDLRTIYELSQSDLKVLRPVHDVSAETAPIMKEIGSDTSSPQDSKFGSESKSDSLVGQDVLISSCCKAPLETRGGKHKGSTLWYGCTKCGGDCNPEKKNVLIHKSSKDFWYIALCKSNGNYTLTDDWKQVTCPECLKKKGD